MSTPAAGMPMLAIALSSLLLLAHGVASLLVTVQLRPYEAVVGGAATGVRVQALSPILVRFEPVGPQGFEVRAGL